MKAISITAHYERKLNTGNYSSVDLGTWATVELEDDDDPAEALRYGLALCREAVKEAAAPFVHKTAVNGNGSDATQAALQTLRGEMD